MVTISRLPASRPPAKDRAKRQILTIIACFIGIYIVTTPFDSSSDADQHPPPPSSSSSSSTYLRGGEDDQREQEPFNYSNKNSNNNMNDHETPMMDMISDMNNNPLESPPLNNNNNDDYRLSNAILSAKHDVKSAETNIVNSQLGELGNVMKREESHVKEHLESVLKTNGVSSSTAERIEREVEGRLEEMMEEKLIEGAEEIERGMEGEIDHVVKGEVEERKGVDEIEWDVGRVEGEMIRDMEVEIGHLEKKLEGEVGFIAKDIETQVLKNELGIDLQEKTIHTQEENWGEEQIKDEITLGGEEELATDDDNADNETSGDRNPDYEEAKDDDDDENSEITDKAQYPMQEEEDEYENSEITDKEQYPIQQEDDEYENSENENSEITDKEQYPMQEEEDEYENSENENSEITDKEQYPMQKEEDDDENSENENSEITDKEQYPMQQEDDEYENSENENSEITNNEQYPIQQEEEEKDDDNDDSTKEKKDDDDSYMQSLESNDTPPMIARNNDSFDEKTPEQLKEEEEELSSAISDAKMDVEEAEEQFISKNMPTLNSAVSKQEQKLKAHMQSIAATEGVDADTMAELEKEVEERLEIKVADSFIAKAETIKREKDDEIDLVVMEDRNVLPGVEEIQKDVGRMEGFFVKDMEKEIQQAEKEVEKDIEAIANDIEMGVLGEKLGIDVVKDMERISSKEGHEVDLSEPIDTTDVTKKAVSQLAEYSDSNGWEFKDPKKITNGENGAVNPDMKKKVNNYQKTDENYEENSEIKEFKTKQANLNFEIDDDVDLTKEDSENKTIDKAGDLKKTLKTDNVEKIIGKGSIDRNGGDDDDDEMEGSDKDEKKREKKANTKDSSSNYNDKEGKDLNSKLDNHKQNTYIDGKTSIGNKSTKKTPSVVPLDTTDDINDSFNISGKSSTIPKDDSERPPDDNSSLADGDEDSFNVSGKPPQKTLAKKSREEWKEELLKKRQERMDSITHHTSTKEKKDKPFKKEDDITPKVATANIKAKKEDVKGAADDDLLEETVKDE